MPTKRHKPEEIVANVNAGAKTHHWPEQKYTVGQDRFCRRVWLEGVQSGLLVRPLRLCLRRKLSPFISRMWT